MKLAFSILFCFVLTSSFAQLDSTLKGRWMLGGNGEMYVERIAGNTGRLILIIEPQAGFFFSNSWAAGIRLPLGFLSNSYQIAVQPFARYYVPLKNKIRPFVELNTGREWKNNLDPTTLDVVYKEQSWLLGGRTGAAFFIGNHVSLDVYLYYDSQNTSWQDLKQNASGNLINQQFGLGVGFQIYL